MRKKLKQWLAKVLMLALVLQIITLGFIKEVRADSLEDTVALDSSGYAMAWEFDGDTCGFTPRNVTGFSWQEGGYVGGTNASSDPYMVSANDIGTDISTNKQIIIKLKNSSSSTIGRVYFTTSMSTAFDEAKSKSFTIIANDPNYTEYTINMSSVSGWENNLKQLRIDPNDAVSGSFSIDYIRITSGTTPIPTPTPTPTSTPTPIESDYAMAWEFNENTCGFTSKNVTGFSWQEGGCVGGTNVNGDPYIVSSDNIGTDISTNNLFVIKLKNGSTSITGRVYFTTSTSPGFAETKSKGFRINANDPNYTEYIIDMSGVSGWTGTLKQLRIDPNDAGVGAFSIDYIRITSGTAPTPPTPPQDEGSAYVWMEGEMPNAVTGDYNVRWDANASGQNILILDSTDAAKTHSADYSFNISKTGTYAIWALSSTGSERYVSRYKWSLDDAIYQNAIPLTRVAGGYTTGDSRKVPMYWDKLDETTLIEGAHSFAILTEAMRELSPEFYYHVWDAFVIVPVDWNWTPDYLNKPVDPDKVSVEYSGGSLSADQVDQEGQITVTVNNRITEPLQGNLSLYAELVWKGQTVAKTVCNPSVPMGEWQINQDYTDQILLNIPYTIVDSQYEVRTGIAGIAYKNTGTDAKVGDITVGQPVSEAAPITARVRDINLPASLNEVEIAQGNVTLELNRPADFDTSGYISFWQGDILWGISEISSLPAGWNTTQTTELSIPVTVPKGLPSGYYTVKFGLHKVRTEQTKDIGITIEGAGKAGAYKPLSFGCYEDKKTGISHTWYVNQAHTMIWDGKPFVPVGGMWTSKFIINFDLRNPVQNKANWEYDLAVLGQMKQNGVKDLYLNAVVPGTRIPAWAWQWIVEHLEEMGFTYGLQLNGVADAANNNSGYIIRANDAGGSYKVENLTTSQEVTLDIATSDVQGFKTPLSTLFLVVDTATGEVVQSGTGTVDPVVSGKFKVRANVVVPDGGLYTVYFTPRIRFGGDAMRNIWDGADETEQAIGNLVSKIETGSGLRLFVDPIVNESGIVNWYESLLMDSPNYRQQFASWLEQKYGSIDALNTAWNMSVPLNSFGLATQLVPLHNGTEGTSKADQVYLMDSATGQIYSSNIRKGVMWDDHLAFRDESFRDFNNRIADRIKQSVNAPVIYKHIGVMKRYNVNQQLHGGFDGLGGEIYGEDPLTLTRKVGDTYATIEQAAKTEWFIVTETQLDENVSRKAASGKIGYPDESTMHEHFDVLVSAGAKGLYDFIFHAPHDENIKNYYSYTAKPEEYGWLENYRNQLLSENNLIVMKDALPQAFKAYAYPAGQMWWFKPTQRTAVLPGSDYQGAGSLQGSNGNWVLPTADWNVYTDTILVSLEDGPATTLWGEPVRSISNLKNSGRKIIYMGLRKNLGSLPNLDTYFTSETATLDNGDIVQVLKPTPTSEVLYTTPDGKVWGLRDGDLWIIANSNWMGKQGSDYMFVKFFGELDLNKAPSLPETPKTPETQSPSTGLPNPTPSAMGVVIDGVKQDNIATVGTVKDGDKSVTAVTLDHNKFLEKLNKDHSRKVVISLETEPNIVVNGLNGQLVKIMEQDGAILEIRSEQAVYNLPAEQIRMDDLKRQFGEQVALENIGISVKIAEANQADSMLLQTEANKKQFRVLVKPIEFEITAVYCGQQISINRFSSYVERDIAIPDGIDPTLITTGVVLGADGQVAPVPTKVIQQGDRYYAVINSLGNSTYSVVGSEKVFTDVENHWSREAVNDLGSRLVIQGVGANKFAPNRTVTRAEFATILVRALGLNLQTASGDANFKDVKNNDWYAVYIRTAVSYGLLKGYTDGTFRADNGITREEAMVMLAQALNYTRLNDKPDMEALAEFEDGDIVDSWAKESVAKLVNYHILSGSNGYLNPKSRVTRAETAAMVWKMLQQADLVK